MVGGASSILTYGPPPCQCGILLYDFVGSFIEIIKVFIIKLLISILTTKSY